MTIIPKLDKCGFYKYDELPEGAVPITPEMFEAGYLLTGHPFVIYSEVYKEYQCHRYNGVANETILEFIKMGRVYSLLEITTKK